ncbi:MAG: hypothetical protein L3J39_10025 [Verrucomicrobiales bacterium]|nr:hypothetical protein [Verrucomicrobiales bacterium]
MKELYREYLKEFSYHLRHYFVAYALLAILLASMVWRQERRIRKTKQILTWPTLTAEIKDSTVTERTQSSEEHPLTSRIFIALELQYEVNDTTYQKNIFKTFTRYSNTDYNVLLAPGNNIQIKCRPGNPAEIALLAPLPN